MSAHSANLRAFLDMIAVSEIGSALLVRSDNGYNVCVGSTPANPILFGSYVSHPRRHDVATNSDAAGRYQFMGRYWEHYRVQLQLPDFGPASQDKWCVQLIRECHALDAVEAGRFDVAVELCRSRWASLPGAGYGQHENNLADLRKAYITAGGKLA
jgi:muramidase (phage lysozyme)